MLDLLLMAFIWVCTLQLNDVAVFTIDPSVSYSTAISPVCLPLFNSNANQFLNQDAAIMGWGQLKTGKQV